jgi:coiled-coil and C2 domain-containing protein 2A
MGSEFDFMTEDELEKNRRFRLIQLRTQEVPEFKGLKLLPIDERNVKKDMFDAYDKRIRNELSLEEDQEKKTSVSNLKQTQSSKEIKNEIEEARAAGQKYIYKIRQQILTQFKFIQNQKTLTDIIIEEQVPNITLVQLKYLKIFKKI